jgi:hypothetical protein
MRTSAWLLAGFVVLGAAAAAGSKLPRRKRRGFWRTPFYRSFGRPRRAPGRSNKLSCRGPWASAF